MTKWSEELIESTKDHFREHYGAELTTEDAIAGLNNLTAFFEILSRWDRERRRDDSKTEKSKAVDDTGG